MKKMEKLETINKTKKNIVSHQAWWRQQVFTIVL